MAKEAATLRLGSEGSEIILAKLREIGENAQASFSKATAAADSAGRKFDATLARLDPLVKANRDLANAAGVAARAVETGARTQDQAARIIDLAAERHRRMTKELTENAKATGLARHEWVNLGRQMTDVGTSLAGGASPFMVLTQQGGQIADVFTSSRGGAAAAVKEFGGAVLRFALNPMTLLAATAAATAYSFYRWKEQTDALSVSLNGLGRQSGLTVSQLNTLAERAASNAGISNASARGLAGQFATAGVSGPALAGGIGVTQDFSRRLGLPFEEAAKQLAEALADPAKGAEDLAKRYGIVTLAQERHIKELQAVGDKSGAAAELIGAVTRALAEMADPTSGLTKLIDRLSNSLSNSLDAWGQLFSEGPAAYFSGATGAAREAEARRLAVKREQDARADVEARRADELGRIRQDNDLAVRSIQARTLAERMAVETERARIQTLRETNDAIKAGIAAENERAKLLAEAARKAEDVFRSAKDQNELARLSPYERAMREIDFKYRDLRAELTPNAATPMAQAFDTAAAAARNVAAAFNDVVEKVGGRRIVNVTRGPGVHAPYDDIIAAEGTGRHGYAYDTSLGYLRSPKPLTQMTMTESLAWGDQVRRRIGKNSSAKGAFQIVNSTQRGAMQALGLKSDDLFDENNQRLMADWIFRNQGLSAWEGFKAPGAARRPAQNDNSGIGRNLAGAEAFERDQRRFELTIKPLSEANKEIDRQRKLLQAQTGALGESAEATARAVKEQELLNQYEAQGVPITGQLRAEIRKTAENYGQLTAEQEKFRESQERLRENLDLVRSSARDALGGIASDLLHGERASKALENALSRIVDRLISLAADRAIEGLFGKSGSTYGGFLGPMLGKLFGFAEGGVMTSAGPLPLRRYASGGVANSPQLTLFGEGRTPEAYVPLQDGRTIPVSLRGNGGGMTQALQAPVFVNVIGAPPQTKINERTDANGGRRVEVVIDERVAASMGSPHGQAALRANNGLAPRVARR